METKSVCSVPWCTALATAQFCAIHTARRVEPQEKREAWEKRLRKEDAAKRREDARASA